MMTRLFISFLVAVALTGPVAAQEVDPAQFAAAAQRLNLTEAQMAAFRPIVETGMRERAKILRDAGFARGQKPTRAQLMDVRQPVMASRARTESELAKILSPSQMEIYRDMVEEQSAAFRARFR